MAVDVARILSTPIDVLRKTDITAAALEALAASRVRRVTLVGRRGHVQAAYTIKELREIGSLDGVRLEVRCGPIGLPASHSRGRAPCSAAELERGSTPASLDELRTSRAVKRKTDLLTELVAAHKSSAAARSIALKFLARPLAFLGTDRVSALRVMRTQLEGPANDQRAVDTGETDDVPAGIAFVSIGYKSQPIEGLPFDAAAAKARTQRLGHGLRA